MNTNTISKFHTSFEIAGGVPVNTKSPVAKRRFMTTHVFLCILDRRVVRHSDEPSVVTYHSDLNWLVCQIPMCLISIEVVTKLVTDVFDFWLYAIKDSNLLAPHQMLSLTTKMVNDTCIVCLSGWILRVHASQHERVQSDSGMNYHHFWPWWIFAKIHKPHKQGTFFPPINQLMHDRTKKKMSQKELRSTKLSPPRPRRNSNQGPVERRKLTTTLAFVPVEAQVILIEIQFNECCRLRSNFGSGRHNFRR